MFSPFQEGNMLITHSGFLGRWMYCSCFPPPLPGFYCLAQCHITQDIPLASLGRLSWFWALAAFSISPPTGTCWQDSMRIWNILGSVQHWSVPKPTKIHIIFQSAINCRNFSIYSTATLHFLNIHLHTLHTEKQKAAVLNKNIIKLHLM